MLVDIDEEEQDNITKINVSPKFKTPMKRSANDDAITTATSILKKIADKGEQKKLPADISGFCQMLGCDLASISNTKKKKNVNA